mmetsp:Transcript_37393/g.48371  ORF Transcript_37393/g.48371 Transcript_37393/m.48371 type:complete len:164 (+) Transcript_37393:101-592(+)|eukprot:CAMPEP_0114346856 /NCGR_PEP_ID=MMETSP0101-20121206/13410_1 /TAXON_ID=38822 ORGANISM="Pteridomonas danica, Strain PT" /NCGR_SAMPLE_ID=MMETSP0101 /ASSEMBLY_ACC=CAM_ASM_000211 /LENGTH=163 /DNA_ID=CAMNT_0001483767 /DNA_START=80 /DNA_END=571 /DNA_ORIENTATION=+
MANNAKYSARVKPSGKSGRRSYAGQSVGGGSKRGGGGNYNWGSALDAAEYDDGYYDEDYYEEEAPVDPSLLTKMRTATIVQEKALAAKYRREGSGSEAAPVATGPAWGQANRVEAMKDRLLALEREKIARMDPNRLELMNLLADHGHNLDEDTVSALMYWKRN